ncbi:MAG: Smr/MutS family protein [Rhodothermaceae bacterium]|nr:Smr/MutS family protein [Rhodothermaceae bacterium]
MPRLSDDGSTVTLDLHGARVEEALALVRRVIDAARVRGRSAVRVVHGASTSDPLTRNRTIKHALYDELDDGGLPGITDAIRFEGETLLSLPPGAPRNPSRLRLLDLR